MANNVSWAIQEYVLMLALWDLMPIPRWIARMHELLMILMHVHGIPWSPSLGNLHACTARSQRIGPDVTIPDVAPHMPAYLYFAFSEYASSG